MKNVTNEIMVDQPVYLGELYQEIPGITNEYMGYIAYVIRQKDGTYYAQNVFQYIHTHGEPFQINHQLDEGGYDLFFGNNVLKAPIEEAPVPFKKLSGTVVGGILLSDGTMTEEELVNRINEVGVPMISSYVTLYGRKNNSMKKQLRKEGYRG